MKRLLLTLISIAGISGLLGALEWYRSGPAGNPANRISVGGRPNSGWTLSIERDDESEYRVLYFDDELRSTLTFVRENGRLISREERDSEGRLVARVDYAYDAKGNPRASYIATGNQSEEIYVEARTSIQPDGSRTRRVSGSSDNWTIIDLDEAERATRRSSYIAGEVSEESRWERSEDGKLLRSTVISDEGIRRSTYDSEGRMLKEQTQRGDFIVLTRLYSWDEDRLVRMEERGEGRTVVREIEWGNDRIEREIRRVDGKIEMQTDWTSPDDRTETLYRDGEPVIRVYWSDERKRKEEFLSNGSVIRVQEYDR